MNRFFIDLSDKVVTLYAAKREIVQYEEFDYPTEDSFVDLLYAKMKDLGINEVLVILHGMVLENQDGNLQLAKGSVYNSKSDMEALDHVFKALGITKASYFDYMGFCLFESGGKKLFVDYKQNLFHLIAMNGQSVLCTEVSTSESLDAMADSMINRFNLSGVVDVNRIVNDKLTGYFTNYKKIDPNDCLNYAEVNHYLSLFAYTMTAASDKFIVTADSIRAINQTVSTKKSVTLAPEKTDSIDSAELADNGFGQEPADTLGIDFSEEVGADSEVDDADAIEDVDELPVQGKKASKKEKSKKPAGIVPNKKKPVKEKPVKKKTAKETPDSGEVQDSETLEAPKGKFKGLPVILCITILIVLVILILASTIGQKFMNSRVVSLQDSYNAASSAFINDNAQVMAYKRLDDIDLESDNLTALTAVDTSSLGEQSTITLTRNELMVTSSFKNEEKLNDFVNTVGSRYVCSKRDVTESDGLFQVDAIFNIK